MIETQSLSRKFSGRHALQDATFSAAPGERIAVVGRNGAGKSTLLRILSTFLPATSGYASVGGFDIVRDSFSIRQIVGYLPENAPLYPDMRVAEYLKFRGRLRRMGRLHLNHRFHEVMSICDLAQHRNAIIGTLSNGLRHRVGIADAILNEPDVLLLDDPLASCDPYQTEKITELLASAEFLANRTLLFTSHSREVVRAVATRIIFLERGIICADISDMSCLDHHSLPDMFGKWLKDTDPDNKKALAV